MYDVTLTNANHLGGLARYNFCSFCIIPLPPLSFFSKWEHKKTAAALSPQTYNSHNYWQIDWVTIAIFLLQYILYICTSVIADLREDINRAGSIIEYFLYVETLVH